MGDKRLEPILIRPREEFTNGPSKPIPKNLGDPLINPENVLSRKNSLAKEIEDSEDEELTMELARKK